LTTVASMNAIDEPRIAAISVIRLTRAEGADAATALTRRGYCGDGSG